ncbi:c-type cytochrome [Nitrosophilus labii]|uniref:c-type cytochrome n=1 Tax=Nitrosophilus labii TaxID=2706014 RepID=UPI0016571B5C|nr:c-type cytochrome [Nitrosophilus labii]
MRIVLLFILLISLFADDSFITRYEYAKMLYENPRGIGCQHCHGVKGEGSIIAKYKDKKGVKYLKAPDIRDVDYKRFYKKLNSRKIKSAMPSYFLTRSEIKTLYYYIKMINSEDKR